MKKPKRSTVIPLCMLLYLGVMAWVGRQNMHDDPTYYWVVMGVSLLIIVGLYFALRRKEQLRERREREENTYGYYNDNKDTHTTKQ